MPEDITLSQAGVTALLGYAIVFLGLFLLMAVVMLFGKVFSIKKPANTPVVAEPAPIAPPAAPGSAGSLKLYNVDLKTAAMLMAIVADKMGKPINELRFLSIREVSQ